MLKPFVLAALLSLGHVHAAPADKAPVFQVLLDISGGSPALNPALLEATWPSIESRLRGMPLGTTVIVSSIGDSGSLPMMWRTRLQARSTKDGAPMEAMVRGLHDLVLAMPDRVRGHEDKKSHLIAGLYEASRNVNPDASTRNVIVMVSDLIEYSPLANCTPPRPCKLPKATFRLDNVELRMVGSATRLQPKQAQTILKAWTDFLLSAGIDLKLERTM